MPLTVTLRRKAAQLRRQISENPGERQNEDAGPFARQPGEVTATSEMAIEVQGEVLDEDLALQDMVKRFV